MMDRDNIPPLAGPEAAGEITLERVADGLPAGFADLEADAKAEGHRHLTRLAAELNERTSSFHAIFACYIGDQLAGIGGITDEPAPTLSPTWRMRRLYVHREYRRHNIGRIIARALLREAAGNVLTVTVHAGDNGAAKFWEAVGFHPVLGQAWSHEARISSSTLGAL